MYPYSICILEAFSSVDSQQLDNKEVEMQACSLIFMIFNFNVVSSKIVAPSFIHKQIDYVEQSKPRIFFRQIIEASGLFPVEINVPDTISSMVNSISWMYENVSSYFNSQAEGGDQNQQQQVSYDAVEPITTSQPINRRHRKKKVKNVKKKRVSDDDEKIFDFISFLML